MKDFILIKITFQTFVTVVKKKKILFTIFLKVFQFAVVSHGFSELWKHVFQGNHFNDCFFAQP